VAPSIHIPAASTLTNVASVPGTVRVRPKQSAMIVTFWPTNDAKEIGSMTFPRAY
jgi:hypothetical protein